MAFYMNWHRPSVLQLIEIYKNTPCMYDVKSPDYLNREKIRAAVEKMFTVVSRYHPEITHEDCKRKYHSLRNQFRKDYLKKRAALKTGEEYVPILWCYEQMTFLGDFIYKATRGNCPKFSDDEHSEANKDKEGNDDDDDEDTDNGKKKNIFSTTLSWKRPAVLRLIEVYQNSPCLYDPKSPHYLKHQKIRETMEKMVEAVSEYHPRVTRELCRRKYHCLRIQYRREYLKMAMTKIKFGAEYEPHLWCYNEMSFLEKYISQTHKHKGKAYDVSLAKIEASKDNHDYTDVCIKKETVANKYNEIEDNDMEKETSDNDKYKETENDDENINKNMYIEECVTEKDIETGKNNVDKEDNNEEKEVDDNDMFDDRKEDVELSMLFADIDREDSDNEVSSSKQDIVINKKRANSLYPSPSTSTVKKIRCDSSSPNSSKASASPSPSTDVIKWTTISDLVNVIAKTEELQREEDNCSVFASFIANCLRDMIPRNRLRAKRGILKIIMQLEEEEIEEKDRDE